MRKSFNESELKKLEQAYKMACAKLELRNSQNAKAIKAFLRRKVFEVAELELKDPTKIRDLALDRLPPLNANFKQRQSGRVACPRIPAR